MKTKVNVFEPKKVFGSPMRYRSIHTPNLNSVVRHTNS